VSGALTSEIGLRLTVFSAVFTAMALWELFVPRRALRLPKRARWTANLGLVALDTVVLRTLFPAAAVGAAAMAAARGWGLLPLLGLPGWAALPVAVVAGHDVRNPLPLKMSTMRFISPEGGFTASAPIRSYACASCGFIHNFIDMDIVSE